MCGFLKASQSELLLYSSENNIPLINLFVENSAPFKQLSSFFNSFFSPGTEKLFHHQQLRSLIITV